MNEPAEALQLLVETPACPPPPVDQLYERVAARRRRRTRRRVMAAGLAVALATVGVVALADRPTARTTRVVAGPDGGPGATTTTSPGFIAGMPVRSGLDFPVLDGWQTLFASDERMAVATRPLSAADLQLALLARDDAAFIAFPADAVVVVVGLDPVVPKYGTAPDGSPIDPGPAYALGAERVLPGGVRTRHGDIPQSIVRIASYAGPSAPAARLVEAETIAAGVRLVHTGDPSVRPPPPPVGSQPGLPGGPLPVPEQGLPEVVSTPVAGSTLVVVAGHDCAYLRWQDAQSFLPGYQPLAGGCGSRPTGSNIATVGPTVLLPRGPGSAWPVAVMFRTGPSVRSVSARLADGRSVPAALGSDGWGVVASDGRTVALTGVDTSGRRLAETLVG